MKHPHTFRRNHQNLEQESRLLAFDGSKKAESMPAPDSKETQKKDVDTSVESVGDSVDATAATAGKVEDANKVLSTMKNEVDAVDTATETTGKGIADTMKELEPDAFKDSAPKNPNEVKEKVETVFENALDGLDDRLEQAEQKGKDILGMNPEQSEEFKKGIQEWATFIAETIKMWKDIIEGNVDASTKDEAPKEDADTTSPETKEEEQQAAEGSEDAVDKIPDNESEQQRIDRLVDELPGGSEKDVTGLIETKKEKIATMTENSEKLTSDMDAEITALKEQDAGIDKQIAELQQQIDSAEEGADTSALTRQIDDLKIDKEGIAQKIENREQLKKQTKEATETAVTKLNQDVENLSKMLDRAKKLSGMIKTGIEGVKKYMKSVGLDANVLNGVEVSLDMKNMPPIEVKFSQDAQDFVKNSGVDSGLSFNAEGIVQNVENIVAALMKIAEAMVSKGTETQEVSTEAAPEAKEQTNKSSENVTRTRKILELKRWNLQKEYDTKKKAGTDTKQDVQNVLDALDAEIAYLESKDVNPTRKIDGEDVKLIDRLKEKRKNFDTALGRYKNEVKPDPDNIPETDESYTRKAIEDYRVEKERIYKQDPSRANAQKVINAIDAELQYLTETDQNPQRAGKDGTRTLQDRLIEKRENYWKKLEGKKESPTEGAAEETEKNEEAATELVAKKVEEISPYLAKQIAATDALEKVLKIGARSMPEDMDPEAAMKARSKDIAQVLRSKAKDAGQGFPMYINETGDLVEHHEGSLTEGDWWAADDVLVAGFQGLLERGEPLTALGVLAGLDSDFNYDGDTKQAINAAWREQLNLDA